jgi:hypothetical protein
MKAEPYIVAIVPLSSIVTSISVGSNLVYSSSDNDDDNSENQICYQADFEATRSGSYNHQQSVCGYRMLMPTIKGLFRVAYHQG